MRNLIFALILLFFNNVVSQSDDCSNAIQITPNLSSCVYQAGSSGTATQSLTSCSGGGSADDDVWYYFVANSSSTTITVDPTVGYDAVIQLFSGTCASLTSLQCEDVNGVNGDEVLTMTSLTVGNSYYLRVYHYALGSGTSTFNICITGLAAPLNIDACNAFALPTVTPSCNFTTYTNLGSAGSSVAAPTNCGGSSPPYQGGYSGGDVWFSVVVPASGELDIFTLSMDFSDGAMALYSGNCSSLTLVECDDDGTPGGGLMPYIYRTGLTPGATMYIRVWEYGNNNNGKFGICVSTPDNDDCNDAQDICDLNGYGGITSSAYTIDRPGNMAGMGEIPPGPFGTGYTGTSPVTIDNNSWLKFTASSTIAQLFIQVHYCQYGLGMQMQIFEGVNCTNFVPVSNFLETANSQTVSASGLTIGQDYYIVVDGFAGDICSYTISATSGVQVVEAVAANQFLCTGDSTSIGATVFGPGPYTYSWASVPAGGTYTNTATINVVPSVSTMYTVEITGVCGITTSASSYVSVSPLPNTTINPIPTEVCINSTLTLDGNPSGGAGTYVSHLWTGLGVGNLNSTSIQTPIFTPTIIASSNLIYTVTDANGCVNSDTVDVLVNALPNVIIDPTGPFCVGDNAIMLTANNMGGTFSGPGVSQGSFDPSSVSAGTHIISYSYTDINGCTNSDSANIVVNSLPSATINPIGPFCVGDAAVNLSAVTPGGTFSGIGVSSGFFDPAIGIGTFNVYYNVTDANSCSNNDSIQVYVSSSYDATINPVNPFCSQDSAVFLSALNTGGVWSGTGIINANTGEFNPSVAGVGSHNIIYTIVASCGDSDSVIIIVNQQSDASILNTGPFCEADSNIFFSALNSGGVWSGNGIVDINTGEFTPSIAGVGTHTVTYIISSLCSDTSSININVNTTPSVSVLNDTICDSNSLILYATGSGGIINWYSDPLLNNLVANDTNQYKVNGNNGVYTFYVVETLGTCSSFIDTSLAFIYDISAMFSLNPDSGVAPVNVQFTNLSVGVDSSDLFSWNFGNGNYSNLFQTSNIYNNEGNYTISLDIASADSSCFDTYLLSLVVLGEMDIEIPNIFTPNNDDINDIYTINSRNISDINVKIFNRWGQLMKTWDGVNGTWDGRTLSGLLASEGTYYIIIEAIDYLNTPHVFKNYFLLTR